MIPTGCPVCNGFESLVASCPRCGEPLEDYGRFFDLLGDYSPYRPIDDLKLTDGFSDLNSHRCPHTVFCRNCGHNNVVMVSEVRL